MKRSPVVALLASVVFVGLIASPVEARKNAGSERVATSSYQTPSPAIIPLHPKGVSICQYGGDLGESRGCMPFDVGLDEHYATIEVTDTTGLPVPAYWEQGGNHDKWVAFCGSTPKPVRIVPGAVLRVRVLAFRAPNLPMCAGTATQGSVEVTFSTSS